MTDHVTATYRVNGEERTVAHPAHHTLLEVLREACGLTGTNLLAPDCRLLASDCRLLTTKLPCQSTNAGK